MNITPINLSQLTNAVPTCSIPCDGLCGSYETKLYIMLGLFVLLVIAAIYTRHFLKKLYNTVEETLSETRSDERSEEIDK